MRIRHFLLPLATSALILSSTAPAAPAAVIASGTTTVAGSGVSPGSATNYKFFGSDPGTAAAGNQPTQLTGFTETAFPQREVGFGNYSVVRPPGGGSAFTTGLAYVAQSGTFDLASFQLDSGSGTNKSFTVYVLYGNSDGIGVYDQSIRLSQNGGTPVSQVVADSRDVNDFAIFNVTGASAGDTFTISAVSAVTDAFGNTAQPYIGGVTFSSITPEPGSFALAAAGGLGLLLRRRRRSS